jgi:hypothetical protein
MATRKKKRRKKKSSRKKSKKRAGKRPLSFLIKNYNRLGRIIKSRGGKV